MTTIDHLLTIIIEHADHIKQEISHRDFTVLLSMTNTLISGSLINENQSRLLIKILKENRKVLKKFSDEFSNNNLLNPTWSKPFRQVQQMKKFTIQIIKDTAMLVIEFTPSAVLKKVLVNLTNDIEDLIIEIPNSGRAVAALTERNIVHLVNILKTLDFEIEPIILEYYTIIKNWQLAEIRNQFQIDTIINSNFQKCIIDDLGVSTVIDNNIIQDRGTRYQYFTKFAPSAPTDQLVKKIAYRSDTKIWIDAKKYPLSDVIGALKELKRLPLLVVFDSNNFPSQILTTQLQMLNTALMNNDIVDNIGVYFRMANIDSGTDFNKMIAEYKYNSKLTIDSQVAAIESIKIPKFFLTSDWKPMSVIVLNSALKYSKSAVYSSCCDLIISYSDEECLIDPKPSGALWLN